MMVHRGGWVGMAMGLNLACALPNNSGLGHRYVPMGQGKARMVNLKEMVSKWANDLVRA